MKQQDLKQQDSDQVRVEKPAFPWLVTTNFFFCFLLLLCLFLPGFKSCSDQTVYIGKGMQTPLVGFTNMPQLIALVVFVATYMWCVAAEKKSSKFAWRCFFILPVANFLLALGFLLLNPEKGESSEQGWSQGNVWGFVVVLVVVGGYLIGPVIAGFIVSFSKRSPFFKASVMQLILSLAGIASAVYFLPTLLLAKKFYVGGKLNVVGVFGLLFMSFVQLMDGERAISRKRGEPIVRLTLKQSFLLMTFACVLCSLAIGLFVAKPPSTKSEIQVQELDAGNRTRSDGLIGE